MVILLSFERFKETIEIFLLVWHQRPSNVGYVKNLKFRIDVLSKLVDFLYLNGIVQLS